MEKVQPGPEKLTEDKWRAIVQNDASYDGTFFYAVKTTRIFCRPSCKSKPPNKENVRVFEEAKHAMTEGFRPCKRCKPTGQRLPDNDWVEQIEQYIDRNYQQRLTLESIADACHGSPYHLHRTFRRIKGVTPGEYLQRTRIAAARKLLEQSEAPMAQIARAVGIPNTSYFLTLFKKMTGRTPSEYRQFYHKQPPVEVFFYEKGNESGSALDIVEP